jgi:hypothetical protein
MGWCHEFGTQVHLGCDHPMVAGANACHCDECGFVCTGKFAGCPDVWARAPNPVLGHHGSDPGSDAGPLSSQSSTVKWVRSAIEAGVPELASAQVGTATGRDGLVEASAHEGPTGGMDITGAGGTSDAPGWSPAGGPEPLPPVEADWPPVHAPAESSFAADASAPPGAADEPPSAAARPEALDAAIAEARAGLLSSVEDVVASAGADIRRQLDEAASSIRDEVRNSLNDALAELRADLARVAGDLEDHQLVLESLVETARAAQPLAATVADLQERLMAQGALAQDAGRIEETLEEARSVLAGMQLAAAAVRAELEQLTDLREQLAGMTAKAARPEEVGVPPVVLEELAETARAGQRLGELVDELPARIAESVADVLDAEPVDPEPIEAEPPPMDATATAAGRRRSLFDRAAADDADDWPAMLREPPEPIFDPPEPVQGAIATGEPETAIQPQALPPILRPGPPEEPIVPVAPPRQAPAPVPAPRSPIRRFRARRHAEPPGTTAPPVAGRRARRGVPPGGGAAEPPLPWEPGQAPPPSLIEEQTATEDDRGTPSPGTPQEPEPAAGDAGDRFDVEALLDLPITDDERRPPEPSDEPAAQKAPAEEPAP